MFDTSSVKKAVGSMKNFFKNVGEIAEVHFVMKEDYFTGEGHVEFTTAEAAQEALRLNSELLLDQPVRLDLARERGGDSTTTPATGSKTLYLGNLSFSIEEDDVKDFFKDVGEIAEIRFAIRDDKFLGYGHIEFTTAEAAQEALKLNNKVILDRHVKLDLARERGAYTPGSSVEKSNQKGGQAHGKTVFVRGFDSSDGFDNIRTALEKHFGKCGEISRMSIPKDYESGAPKGVAFIDFLDSNGFSRALELDGSEVGGSMITVQEAKNQRADSREGSGRGSRGWGEGNGYGGGWGGGNGNGGGWGGRSASGGGWGGGSGSGGGWVGGSGSFGRWGGGSGSVGGWGGRSYSVGGWGGRAIGSGFSGGRGRESGTGSHWASGRDRESGTGGGWGSGSGYGCGRGSGSGYGGGPDRESGSGSGRGSGSGYGGSRVIDSGYVGGRGRESGSGGGWGSGSGYGGGRGSGSGYGGSGWSREGDSRSGWSRGSGLGGRSGWGFSSSRGGRFSSSHGNSNQGGSRS
ncbi:Nucleotide-binding, alpha-beta plait [Cynara cardunculus var. scolymus]|uniref:Nucleotide-binding, alpha-beta plait n=1 Tax=Cynara cardunculus var. scolymus TaxID=59895 RepID=A0A103XTP7_CYNCS|nr:Nucleotide-binding, alpha-beta plait [Cynara cardunculus var. scolymus]